MNKTEAAAGKESAAGETWSPIIELRQYTLHPGKRDILIELFDREFVESQEALGMKVIGQFRTLNDPDRFIWLRGFPDMPTRARALEAFYDGPVWKAHRDAANATMIDSDNVLLLRPARPGSGFVLDGERPPPGSETIPGGIVVATIYHLGKADADDFADFFECALAPALNHAGALILAVFVTENAANNFPRLPIREERALVAFTGFADEPAYDRHLAALVEAPIWGKLARDLGPGLQRDAEVWRLQPTARSLARATTH